MNFDGTREAGWAASSESVKKGRQECRLTCLR